jgi:hypothetical protein
MEFVHFVRERRQKPDTLLATLRKTSVSVALTVVSPLDASKQRISDFVAIPCTLIEHSAQIATTFRSPSQFLEAAGNQVEGLFPHAFRPIRGKWRASLSMVCDLRWIN